MSSRRSRLLVLLLLTGCATQVPPPSREGVTEPWAQTDGVVYRCESGKRFAISFSPDGSRAALKLGETVYELPQVESGSGVHYKSDNVDYVGKGRDAQLLQSPDGAYTGCRVAG